MDLFRDNTYTFTIVPVLDQSKSYIGAGTKQSISIGTGQSSQLKHFISSTDHDIMLVYSGNNGIANVYASVDQDVD